MALVDQIVGDLASETGTQILGALAGAYVVYWLGLRAYFLQKQYEQFHRRYLENGLDLWTSQIDYALGVYRQNWALMLRMMKQYREAEELLTTEDFFRQFRELDHSYFQIGTNSRVRELLQLDAVWITYQRVFSFVGTANDMIKADFGVSLNGMLATPNHPNKTPFLQQAETESLALDERATPIYEVVSMFHNLAELLASSSYSTKDMHKFRQRSDVRSIIERIEAKVASDSFA